MCHRVSNRQRVDVARLAQLTGQPRGLVHLCHLTTGLEAGVHHLSTGAGVRPAGYLVMPVPMTALATASWHEGLVVG
jgi:hypothetical protein